MNEGRAVLVLALFVGGIVGGAVFQRATDARVTENPWPSLDRVVEPAASAQVAAALAMNDARALSQLLDTEILNQLRDALQSPMSTSVSDIRSVKFVGATSKEGYVLAGYILSGKDVQGTDVVVGFVLGVENGEIVGVN